MLQEKDDYDHSFIQNGLPIQRLLVRNRTFKFLWKNSKSGTFWFEYDMNELLLFPLQDNEVVTFVFKRHDYEKELKFEHIQ